MAPFQFSFNLDDKLWEVAPGIKPIVPTSVKKELEILASGGNRMANAALRLSGKYDEIIVRGKGDAPIFNLAVNKEWWVMTQDRRLRDKLVDRGIKVVFLRGRGKLEVFNE